MTDGIVRLTPPKPPSEKPLLLLFHEGVVVTRDTARARATQADHDFSFGEDYPILGNLKALHDAGIEMKLLVDCPIETKMLPDNSKPGRPDVRVVMNAAASDRLLRYHEIFKSRWRQTPANLTDAAREAITAHGKRTVAKELAEVCFDPKIFDIRPVILDPKKGDERRMLLRDGENVGARVYRRERVRALRDAVEGHDPNNVLVVGCFPHHEDAARGAGLRYEGVSVATQFNPPLVGDILTHPEKMHEKLKTLGPSKKAPTRKRRN